ncbi:MAG: hypothetical protein NC200_08070 [Candidatus Gastranaerophilales bacterium]|nr:hypothetical protein [Candidatus Gastranaerophilales bacterium]
MTRQKEFEQTYKHFRTMYFKKHFIDKDIRDAMYETSKEIITDTLSLYTKVCMLIECLSVLKGDKAFLNKLDDETKYI